MSTPAQVAGGPDSTPCGLGRRAGCMLYDGLILLALWMLATAVLILFAGDAIGPGAWWFQAFLVLVGWAYFGVFWMRGGQTIGMLAWRVRLVSKDGPLTPGQTLIRYLVGWVSLLAAGAGFLWSLSRRDRAGWHDLASYSRLVITDQSRAPAR